MSAITDLIAAVRGADRSYADEDEWYAKADAAEAELKELAGKLEGANKLLADAWVQATKRDRADAELLEAVKVWSTSRFRDGLDAKQLAQIAQRWAVAKGGGK